MKRSYIDTKYIDGKRVSEIEETAVAADDNQHLGNLYVQKSSALTALGKEPDNEYWKNELVRIDVEIEIYRGFVDGYSKEAE